MINSLINFIKKSNIILLSIFLCSCGVNTKDWPKISFPFSICEIDSILFQYSTKENEIDTFLLKDTQKISNVYNSITYYPYKETLEKSLKEKKILSDLRLSFFLKYDNNNEYKMRFIEYGISDSLVIFNNEIHYLPGCISYIYTEAKI